MNSTGCFLLLTCDTNVFNFCFTILRDMRQGGEKEEQERTFIQTSDSCWNY